MTAAIPVGTTFNVYWCPRCEAQSSKLFHFCKKGPPLIPQLDEETQCVTATLATVATQAQTLEWVSERWPDRTDSMWRALKLGEEAGEVQGAVIKMAEGRKTLGDLAAETAQLVICAMALAESAGFDLQRSIAAEWARVTG